MDNVPKAEIGGMSMIHHFIRVAGACLFLASNSNAVAESLRTLAVEYTLLKERKAGKPFLCGVEIFAAVQGADSGSWGFTGSLNYIFQPGKMPMATMKAVLRKPARNSQLEQVKLLGATFEGRNASTNDFDELEGDGGSILRVGDLARHPNQFAELSSSLADGAWIYLTADVAKRDLSFQLPSILETEGGSTTFTDFLGCVSTLLETASEELGQR